MLIAPKIELKPAKCILKIAISTLAPILPRLDVKGGYNVQPLPQPPTLAILDTNMVGKDRCDGIKPPQGIDNV
jgi:hypothetical protein